MKQIRLNTFETNSSSTHTLIIVSEDDYEAFKRGDMYLDSWSDTLVPKEQLTAADIDEENDDYDGQYYSYENYNWDLQRFAQAYTTVNGDKIVAFGCYGFNG